MESRGCVMGKGLREGDGCCQLAKVHNTEYKINILGIAK